MFKDAYTIACKEVQEFRSMVKKLLIYIFFVALLVLKLGFDYTVIPFNVLKSNTDIWHVCAYCNFCSKLNRIAFCGHNKWLV